MNMDFGVNKTPVESIKEGVFGGICLVDIYFGINDTIKSHSESHEKNLIKLL